MVYCVQETVSEITVHSVEVSFSARFLPLNMPVTDCPAFTYKWLFEFSFEANCIDSSPTFSVNAQVE